MRLILKQLAPEFVRSVALPEFPWNDWDPYPALGERSDETEFRLLKVSEKARLAYAIGCAAWVVAMLNRGEADDEAWAFLDAAWLCQVSDRFVVPEAPADSLAWEGPRGGPIHLALITVENCFSGTEEGNSEIDASFAELIPAVVAADVGAFREWSSRLLLFLASASPASETEGIPVAPETLAVWRTRDVDPVKSVREFVAAVTTASNPFIDEL